MIEVRKLTDEISKSDILKFLNEFGDKELSDVYGFYDGNACVGCFAIYATSYADAVICYSGKPCVSFGKAYYTALSEMLNKYGQIQGKINLSNKLSLKCAKQIGARELYTDHNGVVHFILNKDILRYKNRWNV